MLNFTLQNDYNGVMLSCVFVWRMPDFSRPISQSALYSGPQKSWPLLQCISWEKGSWLLWPTVHAPLDYTELSIKYPFGVVNKGRTNDVLHHCTEHRTTKILSLQVNAANFQEKFQSCSVKKRSQWSFLRSITWFTCHRNVYVSMQYRIIHLASTARMPYCLFWSYQSRCTTSDFRVPEGSENFSIAH